MRKKSSDIPDRDRPTSTPTPSIPDKHERNFPSEPRKENTIPEKQDRSFPKPK